MDEASIIHYLTETFTDVQIEVDDGNWFFFYGSERKFPFVTLVTTDKYDQASNLNRASVFRLNIGVNKPTFLSLFGADGQYDFTALDTIMPHPVYGALHWVCVLNPSDTTFKTVQPLLSEAYERAARKPTKTEDRAQALE